MRSRLFLCTLVKRAVFISTKVYYVRSVLRHHFVEQNEDIRSTKLSVTRLVLVSLDFSPLTTRRLSKSMLSYLKC